MMMDGTVQGLQRRVADDAIPPFARPVEQVQMEVGAPMSGQQCFSVSRSTGQRLCAVPGSAERLSGQA